MIIGITGRSGVGKNYVAQKLFPTAHHIDIDKIGHDSIQQPENIIKIIDTFGLGAVTDDNGNLSRTKLGDVVFNNRDKHEQLKDITWPYMKNQLSLSLKEYMVQRDNMFVTYDLVLNWILLPLTEFWDMCEVKILVTRKEGLIYPSLADRDGICEEKYKLRDRNSPDFGQFKYDFTIHNER